MTEELMEKELAPIREANSSNVEKFVQSLLPNSGFT